MNGSVVERVDVPEEGRVKWTAISSQGQMEWQYLRWGRPLELEVHVHPDWEDFWSHFERLNPDRVEPYSKLHPEFLGFIDYVAAEMGRACVHLIEKIVPSPSQVARILEVWRNLPVGDIQR